MPLKVELSDTEILVDPQGVLFNLNLEITKRRIELEGRLKGAKLRSGEFEGAVVCVDERNIRCKCTTGTERAFPLTRQKIRQLLADTSRK